MPKFVKILPLKDQADSWTIKTLLEVCKLARDNVNLLFDDYSGLDKSSDITKFGEYFIDTQNPLWAVLEDNTREFAGFATLDSWGGAKGNYHSACVSTCFRKKYWGKFTKWAAKKFVKYVFRKYNLKKLKAEIFARNRRAVALLKSAGFEKEGILRSETLSKGVLCDIIVYSKLNDHKA